LCARGFATNRLRRVGGCFFLAALPKNTVLCAKGFATKFIKFESGCFFGRKIQFCVFIILAALLKNTVLCFYNFKNTERRKMENLVLDHIHDHLNANIRKCEDRAIDNLYRQTLDQSQLQISVNQITPVELFRTCVENSVIPIYKANENSNKLWTNRSSVLSAAVSLASYGVSIYKFTQ
jgi:hypothetical protein